MTHELIRRSAREVVQDLRAGRLTPHEVLDAAESRVAEVDGMVNALPTRCFDRARDHADLLQTVDPSQRGLLAGLPVPIKDLTPVAGVRLSEGSNMTDNYIPERSDLLVTNLESEGAMVFAMSNTPEHGAGGNTFNDVFGPTRNPHDLRLTAGGSSGGAAAALASGSAWLAHGSDLAGSLRTPASFCGVTSLRPSPGLFASGPSNSLLFPHAQQGPMARDIADLALFADAMSRPTSPNGSGFGSTPFVDAANQPTAPRRIAYSPDLGVTTTTAEVLHVVEAAVARMQADGIDVVEDHPDLSESALVFDVPRALLFSTGLGDLLPANRDVFKPELIWNIEQGLEVDAATIRESMAAQRRLIKFIITPFMQRYDLLICPAANTLPFPVQERYPGFSDGVPASDYFQWLKIVSSISATTLPVITIPCGHSDSGLPVGIQLVGKPHGELALFTLAAYLEQLLNLEVSVVDPVAV